MLLTYTVTLDVLMQSVCEMRSWAFFKVKFWTDSTRDCILPKAHTINRVCVILTEALEHCRVVKEVRNELQIEQNTAPVTDMNLLHEHTATTVIEMYSMFC